MWRSPSSVSAIGLRSRARTDVPVDRVGFDNHIIEAYPIAALRLWLHDDERAWQSLSSANLAGGGKRHGYKKAGSAGDAARTDLADAIVEHAGIAVGDWREGLCKSDDFIDALVCALVARLAADPDAPSGIPQDLGRHERTIRHEGWIHLPLTAAPLSDLTSDDW